MSKVKVEIFGTNDPIHGTAIYIDDYRVAGGKPHLSAVCKFKKTVDSTQLIKCIPEVAEMQDELTNLRAQVAEQQWISVDDLKLETRVLLLTESDEVVVGWKRVLKDDNCVYFCFGLETQSWNWEWTYDLGGVIGWMPLPQPPANKDA